jgi:cytochrome o ubiquinol oxidase subunit 3
MSAKHVAEPASESKMSLGLWVYLMTDCILFASLFAVYAVLRSNTANGPSGSDIFNLRLALTETILLLTSSFTSGLALLAVQRKNKTQVLTWLGITFLLGVAFLTLELTEFSHLVQDGNSWRVSGFLSAFYTLVGTHGLHIIVGLLWLMVVLIRIVKGGLSESSTRKLTLFSIYWHFLDIIWIFIFTIVYLMGVIRI